MKNSGITLTDVRNEAFEAIQKLKNNTLDIKTAAEIRNLLGVIIDTAKTQVEFLKSLPNSLKEKISEENIRDIADTLKDKKEQSIDDIMAEIDERNSKPYEFKK